MLQKLKNSELGQRIKADTPDWFKKIRRIGIIAAAAAAALLAANGNAGFALPEMIHGLCNWITVVGITSASVATTAKKD